MTVAELGQRMSASELSEWSVFWKLEQEDEDVRVKEMEAQATLNRLAEMDRGE